jgi:hypothetical protein
MSLDFLGKDKGKNTGSSKTKIKFGTINSGYGVCGFNPFGIKNFPLSVFYVRKYNKLGEKSLYY